MCERCLCLNVGMHLCVGVCLCLCVRERERDGSVFIASYSATLLPRQTFDSALGLPGSLPAPPPLPPDQALVTELHANRCHRSGALRNVPRQTSEKKLRVRQPESRTTACGVYGNERHESWLVRLSVPQRAERIFLDGDVIV